MKTFITILLLFLLRTLCYAQTDSVWSTTDKEVKNKIQELRSKKIDTSVCYSVREGFIIPIVVADDSCRARDIKYLCWTDNHQSYIQRFDECKKFDPVMITPSFSKLLTQNYSKIVKGKIKVPEYIAIVKGKKVLVAMDESDGSYTILEIHVGAKTIHKEIDDFDVQTKYVTGKHLNRNYVANQISSLNRLRVLIEKEIKLHYQ